MLCLCAHYPCSGKLIQEFQENINQLNGLQNFRQASLHYTQASTSEFHKVIDGNYEVFPTQQQKYEIQTKMRWQEFGDAVQ